METENLIEKSLALYKDVKYLYSLLHSFVRFKLAKYYRLDLKGKPIPAHLLGKIHCNCIFSAYINCTRHSLHCFKETCGANVGTV